MTTTILNVDATETDLLLRARQSAITFLADTIDKIEGTITLLNNELSNASLELSFEADENNGIIKHLSKPQKTNSFLEIKQQHSIRFKSVSFEKVNTEINFLKGNLTINDRTNTVEFEARIVPIENQNITHKVLFEILGKLNRQDFDLNMNTEIDYKSSSINQFINVTASFVFTATQQLN